MGGVDTAVELEIDLASPGGQTVAVVGDFANMLEEVLGRSTVVNTRDVLEAIVVGGTRTSHTLDHDLTRASTSVAEAVEHERMRLDPKLLVVLDTTNDLLNVAARVVVVDGSHMDDDLSTIQADPHQGVVGEAVDVVPAQLLCEEVFAAGLTSKLRDLSVVAESIR